MLPPISLPILSGDPPKAIKAAHPPEEPPGDKLVLSGFFARPQKEWHSSAMIACGRLVLQKGIAPASSKIFTVADVVFAVT